jgi:hypothetical protein
MTTLRAWAGGLLITAQFLCAFEARALEPGWQEFQSKKYGFALDVPPEFKLQEEDKTTTFTYQPGADGKGPMEPALLLYVNWVWMPDVPSKVMHGANKKSDQQDMTSPDPSHRDLIEFDRKKGYAYDGNTYWYKEVDKKSGDDIHRWHIKAFGNKSAYTIGLTGTFAQFARWGPVYEKVVKSFRLIPMEGQGGK